MEWISVRERLPDTNGYYLCTYIFDNHRVYYDRWFSKNDNKFSTTYNVTHWMPLPEPPRENPTQK